MTSRAEWERVPTDPDPVQDLQYEHTELDVLELVDGDGRVIVLPRDEAALKDDAFIIAAAGAVCAVDDWC